VYVSETQPVNLRDLKIVLEVAQSAVERRHVHVMAACFEVTEDLARAAGVT
jgi:hypothetical protein